MSTNHDDRVNKGRARLERQIARARRAMLAERLAAALWPVVTALMLGAAFWAFGGLSLVPPDGVLVVIVAFALLVGLVLWRGLRDVRWPDRAAAAARLDADLPGRPISALGDKMAIGAGDAGAQALWAAHLERMADAAAAARARRPDPQLARRDPWALRLSGAVVLGAAILFARAPAPVDLSVPLGGGGAPIAAGPSYEAWANPPAYTGRPTIYLNADSAPVLDLPTGTEVTVRVYGTEGGHILRESVSGGQTALAEVAEGILSASFTVTAAGEFSLSEGEQRLAGWQVTMIPDAPPEIALKGTPGRTVDGAMELGFNASDDYGVVRADATITLDLAAVDRRYGLRAAPEPREALVLDLPMPLSGGTEEVDEVLIENLAKHPWVGLPIVIDLRAEDAATQEGHATARDIELPGRRFFDPLARAILEQRRDLLWTRENAPLVDQMLRAITHAPEDIFDNTTAYMMTRMALRRLGYAAEDGLSLAEQEDIAELLWVAAVTVEDGSLGDARERLRRAQERLSDGLRNGATDEEIAELMDELRQAMQDFMQQLAQEALRNQNQMAEQQPMDPNQMLSPDQLQEMLDRIQELAESGQQEAAEALLEQLRQMLENMQMQITQGGQGQQGQQGQQTMQELQDTLRQQQDLADDSFQELQRQFNQQRQQGQQGQPGQNQPGQQGQGGNQPGQGLNPDELAQRQEALRRMLDQLQDQLPGPGTEGGAQARDLLDEAERQMGDARDNLDEGDLNSALDRQAEALDALREGIRGLNEEMSQQAQQNQGDAGQEAGEGFARDNRDPLGRPSGTRGNLRSDENLLPGEDVMRRARELFDEIRRRSGDQSRPEEELDYLRRLLDRF
ncbi:TIGR02302 family protein [Oceanibium sediminis]|uniref:TIGR02302 family protein n=1 Tax=Oceanibium sediminis TaxID=2026339 RepID=UPI000DD4C266|nr:TIGR02302 family protein [Oceanibium sediminis]